MFYYKHILRTVTKLNGELTELNSKMIKKEGDSRLVAKAGTVSLTYYDSTHLNKIWNVGSEYAGCPMFALMIRQSQTPYAATKSLSCNPIESDGTAEIVADGSGFVRGHILAVYYMIVGHSQSD